MEFVCRLGTPDGSIVEEVHESAVESVLRVELEGRGYHVFTIRPRGMALGLRLPRFGRSRVPMQDFLIFNRELVALLKAGLPLLQSLDILLERGREGRFHNILREVRDRVKKGEDLSDAFAHFGSVFPPLYSSSLKAGERSGEIEQVIRRFIHYLELVTEARRRVVSAVVYPIVLFGVSLVMLAVMTLYVIPQFEVFFFSLNVELPAVTRLILAVSLFLRGNWHFLLIGALALAYSLAYWSRTRGGRMFLDRQMLRIPFIGTILHRFALSQFTRSLGTLLAGGISLVPSIDVAVRAVGNTWVHSKMSDLGTLVAEGRPFYEAIEESRVFTDIAIDMVKVGESTGALDEMLEEVSEFFEQETETLLERVLVLAEPLMLVVMGIVIAFLLIAMYMPMFSAWGQIQ